MRNILVPIDFSSHACQAAHYAVGLAKDLGVEVHLLHVNQLVMPPMGDSMYGSTTPYVVMEPAIKEKRHEAKEAMLSLVAELEATVKQFHYHGPIHQTILEGDSLEEITQWMKAHQPKVMLLGVTERTTLYRMFIGSVAGRLLRQSQVPVIAVPSGVKYRGLETVIFASDFDREDHELLLRSQMLLGKSVKHWHAVHLCDDLEEQYFLDRDDDLQARLREHLLQDEESDQLTVAILSGETLLEGIEKYAREHQASLVAFVTHHRNALARLLDPSVSAEALFHLRLPMLFLQAKMPQGIIW